MVLVVEHIDHASESFRLLAWSSSVAKVDVVGPGDTRREHRGEGERWHVHAEAELTLFESGVGTRLVGDSIQPLAAPDLVLFGPHLPHCWSCRGPSSGVSVQFSIDRTQPLAALPEWRALDQLWEGSCRGLLFPPGTVEEVRPLLARMIAGDRVGRLGGLFELLAVLGRHSPAPLSHKPFTSTDTTKHFPAIQRVVLEILRRFDEPLPMENMVTLADMSRATFCREFKKYTGRSFVDFVGEVRIDAACQRLRLSSAPVSQIAMETGFGNLSHFNRQFRRLKGMSPREYRG